MNEETDPVAVLAHEHVFIKKVVAALDRLAGEAERARQADPETLREIVRFMREFADQCHHAKEEDLLFPAMEEKGVPESGCPLGALRGEHKQGRTLVGELEKATEALAAGHADAGDALADAAAKIKALYTNHIWKEDEMVFPMAGRLFSEDEVRTLAKRFDKAEAEIGKDHEALAAFAERLERETSAGAA